MMSSKEGTTEESSDRTVGDWPGVERRPLLKALGVGMVLSTGSGIAAATDNAYNGQDGENTASTQIDPVFGFSAADAANVPADLEPDHEVELHTQFPENPENPDHPSFFHFEPTGLQVNAGDMVQFTYTDPNHTITAYHPGHGRQRRVPEGVAPFSSPIVPKDGAWLYRFDEEGLYDLYCGAHEIAGMNMRLVVGDLAEGDIPDYEDSFMAEPPLVPPVSAQLLEAELNATNDQNENCEWVWPTPVQILTTDALDPMNIQEQGQVPFEAVADELGLAFVPEEDDEAAAGNATAGDNATADSATNDTNQTGG